MSSDAASTDRERIQTYVPAYQKATWERHADELGMSLSEFVRTMVQAGRSDVAIGDGETAREEPPSSGTNPGGRPLEDRIEAVLRRDGPLAWDELVASVTDDVERRIDEALDELQDEGRVKHSGREGGYVLE